jgi:hypothetical protein
MKKVKHVLSILLIAFCGVAAAQPTGFWEVTKVSMGDREMTPIAKWSRINEDGTFQSGNGWLQNSAGTWKFDKSESIFIPFETNGIRDPFGGFKVKLSGDRMTWEREEEGALVTVTWTRIESLPMAPADQLKGLWDLKSASKDGIDIQSDMDPDNNYNIHIRWDRLYIERSSNGKSTGYWFINAHYPELTLMNHDAENKPIQSWMISFENDHMVWTGNSDSNRNTTLTFERLNKFPN